MLLNDKKTLFIHIPRTAGTWIETHFHNFHDKAHLHRTYRNYIERNPAVKNYFKFTFVRNPWDRLVSWYFHHANYFYNDVPKNFYGPGNKEGFTKWVRLGCPHHWKIQSGTDWGKEEFGPLHQFPFLIDGNNKITMDFIGRYESLQSDFDQVCKKINWEQGQKESQRIKPSEHAHYSCYYNDETKHIVAEKFKKDIEMFGYIFQPTGS